MTMYKLTRQMGFMVPATLTAHSEGCEAVEHWQDLEQIVTCDPAPYLPEIEPGHRIIIEVVRP